MNLRALSATLVLVPALLAACRALEPTNGPIDTCARSCKAKASRQCSADECDRGCELILDRIIERESELVITCVARSARRCSDLVWADCAAHVGIHADGGPPGPPPPPEDD